MKLPDIKNIPEDQLLALGAVVLGLILIVIALLLW